MSDPRPLDAEAATTIARVRRLMVIVVVATFLAVAAVIGVIGYRVFHLGESVRSASPADMTATLPAGAKVLSSAVGDDRIVLTVEINGAIELRTFDLHSLKPLGRQQLQSEK